MNKIDFSEIVNNVLSKYKTSPIDILNIGDEEGEYNYLISSADSYVRTIKDIDNILESKDKNKKILEIGSFLGSVSIALKNIGYDVSAMDIPEFYNSKSLRSLYKNNDIPFVGINLRGNKLPYDSNSFDVVIICEVIEHLSFNPLPVFQEINRILKKSGFIYIGMPNQAHFINRIKLLFGKSIFFETDYFFKQLDKNKNDITGLHWREYTMDETVEILETMEFEIIKKYFPTTGWNMKSVKKIITSLLYWMPSFRPHQVVIGRKKIDVKFDFWLTEANS